MNDGEGNPLACAYGNLRGPKPYDNAGRFLFGNAGGVFFTVARGPVPRERRRQKSLDKKTTSVKNKSQPEHRHAFGDAITTEEIKMKWLLGLLIGMLLASPAVAQVTRAEGEQIVSATDARILAELEKINVELATVKADIAVMKADIAALKTDVAVMKNDIRASEEKTSAEIRGLTRQLSFVQFLLGILVTGLLTVLLAFLKNQWDKRKEGDEKLGAQQKELTEQQKELTEKEKALAEKQSEIDALRAENERIKNTLDSEVL